MANADIVIFAIQAGIKLGGSVNKALVAGTSQRPLILPVGDLFGSVQQGQAVDYFLDHPELEAPGAPYAGLNNSQKLEAYKTILAIRKEVGDGEGQNKTAEEIVLNLGKFEQLKKGYGTQPVALVLGTVADIAVDYFSSDPRALEGDSDSKKILRSFIQNLDQVTFSSTPPDKIVSVLLFASLKTLKANVTLLDDDKRLTSLVSGITQSLIDDYENLSSTGAKKRRGDLIKRVASSMLKGGAAAFTENIDLYLGDDPKSQTLVKATLSQVIAGIDGKDNLFTNESLELIFKSALKATGENAALFTDNDLLKDLIGGTLKTLSKTSVKKIFSEETAASILQIGLEAAQENIGTLINPDSPDKEILSNTIAAMASGLATNLASGGNIRDLLSKKQVKEIATIAFQEVAKNPEGLIGGASTPSKEALAQIIGSMAKALESDPGKLVNGESFVELFKVGLETAVLNADKLLNLNTGDARTNMLFKITSQAAKAALEQPDPRKLITREVFLSIVKRVLPVASANLDGLLASGAKPIEATISGVLEMASDTLQNRINGANLPMLVEEVLRRVLQDELNLDDSPAVVTAAKKILKAA